MEIQIDDLERIYNIAQEVGGKLRSEEIKNVRLESVKMMKELKDEIHQVLQHHRDMYEDDSEACKAIEALIVDVAIIN